MAPATAPDAPVSDVDGNRDELQKLAKGGRTNFLGFILRLVARLPFLYLAGRWYGADALGRFAYAILVVEFAAQIATLGLKRGLAQQLAKTDGDHAHVVWDGLLVAAIVSAIAAGVLIAVPQLMFPTTAINGYDRLLPLVIFAVAGTDIALAALAYRYDIGATVRARSIVEPWAISIGAFGFGFYSLRDGLILAYVASMLAAFATALYPLLKSYGLPRGWKPRMAELFALARQNMPLAAADAIEWGSRRLDIAILGLFASPAIVGIYYVAQQVASLPQKLKTSFDPILGPVITRALAENRLGDIAKQISQVGFWIIAAQTGIALALGIPGEGVMGLVGATFVSGTAALAFLLAAEVVAATAVVSESVLVYMARHRNLWISLAMLAVQAGLSVALILLSKYWGLNDLAMGAAVALALAISLALASIIKSRLLSKLLGAQVNTLRPVLIGAAAGASVIGWGFTTLPPSLEWLELSVGVPVILGVYGLIIWKFGLGPDDRLLFRKSEDKA